MSAMAFHWLAAAVCLLGSSWGLHAAPGPSQSAASSNNYGHLKPLHMHAPTLDRWLAPEVLSGGSATAASDTFAFGVVMVRPP